MGFWDLISQKEGHGWTQINTDKELLICVISNHLQPLFLARLRMDVLSQPFVPAEHSRMRLDAADPLRHFHDQFLIPNAQTTHRKFICGHSPGCNRSAFAVLSSRAR
jgi:hypothetical protein